MRMALALRANPAAQMDTLIHQTAEQMRLDEPAFSRYVADNMAALRRAAHPDNRRGGTECPVREEPVTSEASVAVVSRGAKKGGRT